MLFFRHLMSLPPRETLRLVRRRLPLLHNGPAWRPIDLLASTKHRSGVRFADFLLRQQAILEREIGWEPLDFEGKRVVEVGCGPLAGYGPLAIFCGAKCFESAEPEWDDKLFASDEIVTSYLHVMHADLVALYGPKMDFGAFRSALAKRITVHRCGFDAAPVAGKADIVLSQSCLEHVFPLDATVRKLAEIQTRGTRFIHLVDFGNHQLTPNPFDGLYNRPAADYIAKRGKAINMLRSSDVSALFEEHGISAQAVPARVVAGTYRGDIHPWWRERYDEAALFTQLSLIAGPAR